jgi:HAD superfamily hydrolase (TIGR01509 family)
MSGADHALKISRAKLKVVAIVSSGSLEYINQVLNKFNLSGYLDFIISGDQVTKGKPNPECYLKAFQKAKKLVSDINKHQCLVVEDAPIGVQSAQAAGFPVLFVQSRDEYQDTSVDYKIKSLEDFGKFLNNKI